MKSMFKIWYQEVFLGVFDFIFVNSLVVLNMALIVSTTCFWCFVLENLKLCLISTEAFFSYEDKKVVIFATIEHKFCEYWPCSVLLLCIKYDLDKKLRKRTSYSWARIEYEEYQQLKINWINCNYIFSKEHYSWAS